MMVDYVLLNKIVVERNSPHLLEHVAQRIITRVFSEIPEVSRILLGVSKINPPIGGDVESTVELEEYRT
jgi:dihydroneopterin aldolase